MLLTHDNLELSFLLPMPIYHLFDRNFSVHFLKDNVQKFPIFLRSGCLGSGTHEYLE